MIINDDIMNGNVSMLRSHGKWTTFFSSFTHHSHFYVDANHTCTLLKYAQSTSISWQNPRHAIAIFGVLYYGLDTFSRCRICIPAVVAKSIFFKCSLIIISRHGWKFNSKMNSIRYRECYSAAVADNTNKKLRSDA